MSKRAERRKNLQRMKNKAKKVYSSVDPSKAIKWANHLKVCSCHGCCNPRRSGYFKNQVTRQESEAYMKYLESLSDSEKIRHCRYGKAG